MKRDAGHEFGSDTSCKFPVLLPVKREFRNPNLLARTPSVEVAVPVTARAAKVLADLGVGVGHRVASSVLE